MSSQEVEYQISVLEDRVNKSMERREIKIEVASQASPKRDLLRRSLASALKVPLETVFIKSVLSSYGTNVAVCKAHVYDNAERGKFVEPEYIRLRNLSRGDRKAAMTAAPKAEGDGKSDGKKPASEAAPAAKK